MAISEDEMRSYHDLRQIVGRLRAPDGCPWDREQTHASLRPYVVREAYEVVAALDAGEPGQVADELGDLLFQVLIHTQIGEEHGSFTMEDILAGLAAKLIRRHPHVFSDLQLTTASEVLEHWEELKRQEKAEDTSVLEDVPIDLPALAYAQEVLRKTASLGIQPPATDEQTAARLVDEIKRDWPRRQEALGRLLLGLAALAVELHVDAEEALRLAAGRFRDRFEVMEAGVRTRGGSLKDLTMEERERLWQQAGSGQAFS